ncbi:hypothetical protein ACFLVR_02550 [Chloroflexota bacterium]
MKRRFKFMLAGVLALGLLIAGTASALAGPTAESINGLAKTNEMSAEELGALVAELEAVEGIEIIPVPEDEDAKVKILGGFHGKWGVDEADEALGGLAGIYGSVTYKDGSGYGFLGGIWKIRGEKTVGYLIGKYADSAFWGIYRNYAGENGGMFGGTYAVGEEDVAAMVNRFDGKWMSNDGERSGYIKGKWAQKVGQKRIGRFGGKWYVNDDEAEATTERPEADGRLGGHYGAIKLADDTVINLFRGKWNSADGAEGKLTGIGIRGHFYGIWNGEETSGYMMGKSSEHRFRGVWGTFGQEPQGKLAGRYGRYSQPNEAELEAVKPAPVPTNEPVLQAV